MCKPVWFLDHLTFGKLKSFLSSFASRHTPLFLAWATNKMACMDCLYCASSSSHPFVERKGPAGFRGLIDFIYLAYGTYPWSSISRNQRNYSYRKSFQGWRQMKNPPFSLAWYTGKTSAVEPALGISQNKQKSRACDALDCEMCRNTSVSLTLAAAASGSLRLSCHHLFVGPKWSCRQGNRGSSLEREAFWMESSGTFL